MARSAQPRAKTSPPAAKHSRGRTAGIVGTVVGLAAAGTAAGVAASRIAGRRVQAASLAGISDADLREDDPLGPASRRADRTALVQADDGVLLAVDEIGPRDAPLTVVYVHDAIDRV